MHKFIHRCVHILYMHYADLLFSLYVCLYVCISLTVSQYLSLSMVYVLCFSFFFNVRVDERITTMKKLFLYELSFICKITGNE